MSCKLKSNNAKKSCVQSDKQLDATAPQAGQPIPGWRGGAQGLKKDAPQDQGQRRHTCGLQKPMPGAEGLCHRHSSAQSPPLHGLEISCRKAKGLVNVLPQFWEREHRSGMLGRCRKDSEQSGLEGMRPRNIEALGSCSDEGTS